MSLQQTIAPSPSTTRGFPCVLSTDKSGQLLAYASGSTVIVRNISTAGADIINTFSGHNVAVTAVRLSPSGAQCASGDKDGNLRVWWVSPKVTAGAAEYRPLSGTIRDIAWSHDDERVAVVGDGRETRGVVLNAKAGNTMGNLTGPTKEIMTCDFRKDRPFRVVTGSADSMLAFFDGPPFKFNLSIKDAHKATVTCARYSPDSALIASVSGGDAVVLQDGLTGELKAKFASGHTGTIYGVAWSADSATVVTASADKTVRGFSAADGSPKFTLKLGDTLAAMQLGIVSAASGWVSVNLLGDLTFITPGGTVARILSGSSGSLRGTALHGDAILTASGDGRVLLHRPDGSGADTLEGPPLDFIRHATLSAGKLVIAGAEALFTADPERRTLTPSGDMKGAIAVAALAGGETVVATPSAVFILRDGKEIAKHDLGNGFRTTDVAAGHNVIAVAGAGGVWALRFTGGSIEALGKLEGYHQSDVSAVAVSDDGAAIATGDVTRNVAVWDVASRKPTKTELVYHSSRINCLAFAPKNAALLASGSLDRSVIVWDLATDKRTTLANAHYNGVTAIHISADGKTLLSGGADGFVRRWSLP
jgi:WD40 repeat protein